MSTADNALAATAMRHTEGDRRQAVRLLIDSAIALVMAGTANDQKWASELLLNRAADADPDLDEIFGDESAPVH